MTPFATPRSSLRKLSRSSDSLDEQRTTGNFETMRATISMLSATMTGSLVLQCYFSIWRPSSFGRFAEFSVIVLYAVCIVVATFLLFVLPTFVWLRRTQRRISWLGGFVAGLFLGSLVMLLFMALSHWPVRNPELGAASLAGAVGTSIYASLTFKRGAEPFAAHLNGGPAAQLGNSEGSEGPPSVS
jgi:multisubunit Na+/H+ antiporter MnhB subunit